MHNNTEEIKNRMIKRAALSWGLPENESETSFDPLVAMLISACAAEINNLSGEIAESRKRITEKLIEIMSSDITMGVKPAHCLACAKPVENKHQISLYDTFYILPENTYSKLEKQLFFVPAGDFSLYKSQLEYMVYPGGIARFDNNLNKYTIKSDSSQTIPSNELWIALNVPPQSKDLQNLSVCFDFRSNTYRKLFYFLLKNAQWSTSEGKIDASSGLSGFDINGPFHRIFGKNSTILKTYLSHIRQFYNEKFVTLNLPEDQLKPGIPEELKSFFSKFSKPLEPKPEKLVWLKIELPQNTPPGIYEFLTVGINIFPLVNLEKHTGIFRTAKHLNVFSLNCDSYFFDIETVDDSLGNVYSESTAEKVNMPDDFTFVLRGNGSDSYDSRTASEHIKLLSEKLKNESSAFNFVDKSSFNKDLKTLEQIMAKLDINIQNLPKFASSVYVFIKAKEDNIPVGITYWETSGDSANGIKALTPVNLYNGSYIEQGSSFLFSNTYGGKTRMTIDDQVNSYKRAMLSRDRIISTEDIMVCCKEKTGNLLEKINIEKGIFKEMSSKEGYTRTIDIYLYIKENIPELEKEFLCKDLLITLNEKSSAIFPFRIFVNKIYMDV